MIYNFPERAERPLTWVVRHTVHEGEHHLLDIGRVLRAASGRCRMTDGLDVSRLSPSDAVAACVPILAGSERC